MKKNIFTIMAILTALLAVGALIISTDATYVDSTNGAILYNVTFQADTEFKTTAEDSATQIPPLHIWVAAYIENLRVSAEMAESASGKALFEKALNDKNSDLYILSRLIKCEAGPSLLDKLLVGAVFMNRVDSDIYPNTAWEVLTQKNQYTVYPERYDTANWQPDELDIKAAMLVLSGKFTIPANVLGQSTHIQGKIYKTSDNGPQYKPHYYCTLSKKTTPSKEDRFGNPAPKAEELEALAKELDRLENWQDLAMVKKFG